MSTVFIVLIILVALLLLGQLQSAAARRKRMAALGLQWGKQKEERFPFHLISQYTAASSERSFHQLSLQTMTDIDFDELFMNIDRTVSKPGQQFLYHQLKNPSGDKEVLRAFDERVEFFLQHDSIRIKTQQCLLSLADPESYSIAKLLNDELIRRPSWFNWLYLDLGIVVTLLVLSPFYPVCLILLVFPLAINLFLHFWNANNTFGFIRSLPQLNKMIRVTEELNRLDLPFKKDEAALAVASLSGFRRKLNFLTLGDGGVKDELTQAATYLLQVVKALFLVEVITFFRLIKELEHKQQSIRDLFVYTGAVDVAISVASLRSSGNNICKPVLLAKAKRLHAVDIYHPLIEESVVNTINVEGKSVLITGSNMSGKTSFLRTVAINSLLAQTIYTCFARSFEAPLLKVSSSIRIDDDLLQGRSYYFEEVNVMGELIRSSRDGHQHLFILDEVFKGTNTVERIAAARAILSYLNQLDNLVFVATHDIELAAMLADEYDLYHFSEDVKDDTLQFDHLLKPGPLTTRNAIRILEISGYPEELVAEARKWVRDGG